MQVPLQISFHGIPSSEALTNYIRSRAEKLDQFYDRITSCRVALEAPHRHQNHGGHYRVRVDMVVPGSELVVSRDPTPADGRDNAYATIDEAFDDAKRVLEEWARRRRGEVKSRAEGLRQGKVTKLFRDEGYGFIESPEGYDVYFHRNSVLHRGFDRLEVGSEVKFAEEEGDKGPQASSVAA
jgi:cold shock CspA family protein